MRLLLLWALKRSSWYNKADWNKDENTFNAFWSSVLIFIWALADDVFMIHSTRKFDDSSVFCAKEKNFKLGYWPPDAMQWKQWLCICWRSAWGVCNAATPWGLRECSYQSNIIICIKSLRKFKRWCLATAKSINAWRTSGDGISYISNRKAI